MRQTRMRFRVPDDPRITLVCLDCLIDDHPEIGRGLEIARRFGVADVGDDGVWIVGNMGRPSPA